MKHLETLSQIKAETEPEVVRQLRLNRHDIAVLQSSQNGQDRFVFVLDGETFANNGIGWQTAPEAEAAARSQVQAATAVIAGIEMTVKTPEGSGDIFGKIVQEMNRAFKSQDQFEQQFDTICLDIAGRMGLVYERDGDKLSFIHKSIMTSMLFPTLTRITRRLKASFGTGHPDHIEDIANLILVDAVYTALEQDAEYLDVEEETLDEMRRDVRGELTETIPNYFSQDDFGYHRYLPTAEAERAVAVIDKMLAKQKDNVGVTALDMYAENPRYLTSAILQLAGHGVSPTDDPGFKDWAIANGIDPKFMDQHPYMEYTDAYDSARNLINDFVAYQNTAQNTQSSTQAEAAAPEDVSELIYWADDELPENVETPAGTTSADRLLVLDQKAFPIGAGTTDRVSAYRQGEEYLVLTQGRDLHYAGLSIFSNRKGAPEMLGEVFLQQDQDFESLMQGYDKDLYDSAYQAFTDLPAEEKLTKLSEYVY